MNTNTGKALDLNVASGEAAIYQDGNIVTIGVADLVGNEVALRQLLNTYNLMHQAKEEIEKENRILRDEVSAMSLSPVVSSLLSLINVIGVVLLGFGVDSLAQGTPPNNSTLMFVSGLLLVLISSGLNPFTRWLSRKYKERNNANAE